MQALTMIGPSQGTDQTEVRKVEDLTPGPGEVTIDVAYAGINFMDVMARRGDPGYASGWPYVPGLEVSGSVREVGDGFSTLEPGQRVVAYTPGGGLAEVARTTGRVRGAAARPGRAAGRGRRPAHADDRAAAADRRRPVPAGRQRARARGQRRHRQRRRPAGAGPRRRAADRHRRAVPTASPPPSTTATTSRWPGPRTCRRRSCAATNGVGADIVLDPQGTVLLDTDLAVTAPGGRIVLFGNAGGG